MMALGGGGGAAEALGMSKSTELKSSSNNSGGNTGGLTFGSVGDQGPNWEIIAIAGAAVLAVLLLKN
jgi:hypothetical protein